MKKGLILFDTCPYPLPQILLPNNSSIPMGGFGWEDWEGRIYGHASNMKLPKKFNTEIISDI